MANAKIVKKKIRLQRRDVVELSNAITSASSAMKGKDASIDLVYAMKKNRDAIRPIIDAVQEAGQPSPEMDDFHRKRMAKCEECSEQENGRPKMNGQEYVIDPEKATELRQYIDGLRREYSEVLQTEDRRARTFQRLVREEEEIDVLCFPSSLLPIGSLSVAERMGLYPLLVDADTLVDVEENEE